MNYDDDDYSQGYYQIKEAFKDSTKNDILNTYISDHVFRSMNINAAGEATNDIGYNLYVFEKRYQKNIESAQTIKREFNFSEDVPAGIYSYALVLQNKLVSISTDS